MKAKTRETSPKSRFTKQLIGIILCITILVVTGITTYVLNYDTGKTIDVCTLATDIDAGVTIKESDLVKYQMNYKEYESCGIKKKSDGSKIANIITWNNRVAVIGKYQSASFLYKDSFLMPTMLTSDTEKKFSYLYSMDGELLNIKMNTSDFGEMVVPGDRLNIYATYTETVYDLPSEESYLLNSNNQTNGVQKNVTKYLFNECTVLDMLNGDEKSIFDIYYNFMGKTKVEQEALLKSDDFLKSVNCASILLQVTPEEAIDFANISSYNPSYLITLLPRTESNAIVDSLTNINNLIKEKK